MNADGNAEPNGPESSLTAKPVSLIGIVIGVVIIIVVAAVLVPVLTPARDDHSTGTTANCLSNTKSLGAAFLMYMADNDDRMPPGDNWLGEVDPYIRSKAILKCPSASTSDPCYAFNSKLGKVKVSDINASDSTVMIFESIPGMNQCGGKELLPSPPRHPKGHSIAFADGHVKMIGTEGVDALIW